MSKDRPPRVYLRGESWYCDIYVEVPGRRRRKRIRRALVGAGSLEDAVRLATQFQMVLSARVKHRGPPLTGPMTVRHFVSEGWAKYSRPGCKPSTLRRYEQDLRVHLLPHLGGKLLHEITVVDVEILKGDLRDQGLAPSTINHVLGLLRKILNDAVRWELIQSNPVRKVRLLKVPKRTGASGWTVDEGSAFLAVVREHRPRWYPLFITALRTGLRLGELAALKKSDLDLGAKEIHVKRAMSAGEETNTKSGREYILPIDDGLVRALHAHMADCGSRARVFVANDGSTLTSNNVKSTFGTCIRLAGVPRIRFHDLRHTFAEQLAEVGVPLEVLKDLLNHSDSRTTQRYSKTHLAVRREAIRMLPSVEPEVADDDGEGWGLGSEPPDARHPAPKDKE